MNEVFLTSDKSSSVYSSRFDAMYHSKYGAIQESEHIFINSGYRYFLNKSKANKIKILEIGYGTGLNALLTAINSNEDMVHCEYHGLEAYPVDDSVWSNLNYGVILNSQSLFKEIHGAKWNQVIDITSQFSITKIKTLFEEYNSQNTFDIIYFDPFAPDIQNHLWEEEIMKIMYSVSKKGSILVTYCAKGVVRRTLEKVGFRVDRIPGPPGKREMIRATKCL